MANIDLKEQVGKTREQSSRAFEFKKTIDCSVTNLATADVAAFLTVEPGTVVENVFARVITPQGGAATFHVGDVADPNGFVDANNANAAANTLTKGGGAYAANGKLYTANTDLSLVAVAALDTAVIEVIVKGFMIDL